MQDSSDNNINIHDWTRNRSEADNTAQYLVAMMQRSERPKRQGNLDKSLDEECDAVAGEGDINDSPLRSFQSKSP